VRKLEILVSDLTEGTQYNYLVTLKEYIRFCKSKGFEDPFTFDLVRVKEFLSRFKPTTRGSYGFRLRKIFRFNGEQADFKVRRAENELPEVLTEQEMDKIIRGTSSLKWRALFRLAYEGAMRVHEVLTLKIKHVRFDEVGAEVFVPSTKSQALWLRIIDSVPLLQAWLEQHPNRDEQEAWVFPGRKEGKPLSHLAFYMRLKRTSERVGIQKRVFPHLLRHSRLAWLKKFGAQRGISDSTICLLYGRWARRNAHRMLDRYGLIEPHEANEIVLRAFGKIKDKQVVEPISKPQICIRCKRENDAITKYCSFCGMILDQEEAARVTEQKREETEQRVKEIERLKGEFAKEPRWAKELRERQEIIFKLIENEYPNMREDMRMLGLKVARDIQET